MQYKLIENVLPFDTCVLASKYLLQEENDFFLGDGQVPNAKSFPEAKHISVLLPIVQPQLEKVWGVRLIPTYSYSRVLYPGTSLMPHTDRPACEYSITVTLGHNYPEDFSYPIFMGGVPVDIPVSWGATYKGCEIMHWREPLVGNEDNFWIQAFFHYVNVDGPFAEYAWDGRFKTPNYDDEGLDYND